MRTAILITPILRLGTPLPTTLLLRPLYCNPPLLRPPRHYDHPVITTTMLFYPPPPTHPQYYNVPDIKSTANVMTTAFISIFQLQTKVHKFFVFHNNTLFIHAPFTSPLLPLTLWSLQFFPSRSYLTSITVISVPAQRRRRQRRSLLSHLF